MPLIFAALSVNVPVVFAQGQVGINTEAPLASLDVVGNLRVTDVQIDNNLTDVLVLGADNVVRKRTNITPVDFPVNTLKSFVSATGASAISLVNLQLLNGWYKIPFPNETFDENGDYNTTTSEFIAPATGIYNIFAQFRTASVVSAAEVGIGIFKRDSSSGVYSLLADETYLSVNINLVGLINVDVSPPTRKTQKLVKLNQGDAIIFGAKVPLLSVQLVGGSSSFFTINQVK